MTLPSSYVFAYKGWMLSRELCNASELDIGNPCDRQNQKEIVDTYWKLEAHNQSFYVLTRRFKLKHTFEGE